MARADLGLTADGPATNESLRPPAEPVPAVVVEAVGRVRLHASGRNTPVVIEEVPPPLRVVGFGTDAVVVHHPAAPERVVKVYAAEKITCLEGELQSYQRLAGSPFFPVCFGRGDRFLVLSYERGPTLLECLVRGIPIPPSAIDGVEEARDEARRVGLYPRDIHLNNVLLQGDGVKVLDLSRYVVPGDDLIWDHLALGYRRLYPLLRGRSVPLPLIELVKRLYRARRPDAASIDQFLAHLGAMPHPNGRGGLYEGAGRETTVPVVSPSQ